MASSMSKYVAELIGTFAFFFVGTSVAVLAGSYFNGGGATDATGAPIVMGLGPAWILISFAFGFTLMTLAFALGGVSGAHLNPAVTIAMLVARRIGARDATWYIVMQVIGATIASVVVWSIVSGLPGYTVAQDGLGANGNPQHASLGSLFLLEVVLTALFLLVILSSTDGRNLPPGLAPVPIGVFLFVAHLIGVPLGDASLNPARSIGPAIVTDAMGGDGSSTGILWLFIVAPIVGGLIGYFIYSAIWPPERKAVPAKAPRRKMDADEE